MKKEPPTVTAATIEVTYSDGTRERHTFNGAKKATFQIGLDEPNREYHVGDGEPYFTTTPGQIVRDEPNCAYHRVDDESYFTTTPGQIKHLQFSLQYLTPYPNGVVWLTEDLNSTEPLDLCQADSLF